MNKWVSCINCLPLVSVDNKRGFIGISGVIGLCWYKQLWTVWMGSFALIGSGKDKDMVLGRLP